MWSVLFGGTVPWAAAIATLLLVLTATLLIIHQVRASDGDMSVRLRWLGLHVQRSAPPRAPQTTEQPMRGNAAADAGVGCGCQRAALTRPVRLSSSYPTTSGAACCWISTPIAAAPGASCG